MMRSGERIGCGNSRKRDGDKREANNRTIEENEQKRKDRKEAALWKSWSIAVQRHPDIPKVNWCRYFKNGNKLTKGPDRPFPYLRRR